MNKKILITLLAISAVLTSCGNTESNADPIDTESSSIAEVTTEATTTTAAAITSVSDVTTTQITTTENEKKSTTTTKVTKPKTTTSKKKTTTSQTTQAPPETQATQPVYTKPATQAQTQPVTQIVTQPQTQATQKVTQATQATSKQTEKQTSKQTEKQTEKPKTDEQTEFEKAWEAVSYRRSNAAQREIIRQKIIEYVLENYGGTVDDSLYLFTDKDGNLTNENKPGNFIGGKGQWAGGMTPCPGDTWELFITDEVPYWCDFEYTRFTEAGNKFDKFNIIPWEDDAHDGAYFYTFVVW